MAIEVITADQKALIQQHMDNIPAIEKAIADAEKAGIDVAAQKAQLAQLKQQLAAIHAVYVAPSIKR